MTPHEPSKLCAVTPSILSYVDWAKSQCKIHHLDLSELHTNPSAQGKVIHTQQTHIYNICFVQDGDKQLMIVSGTQDDCSKLFAYNTLKDKIEWKLERKPSEMEDYFNPRLVTTDGHGHLFVADLGNQCIQMFHMSDARHMGCLMKCVDTNLVNPYHVCWNQKTSSLVVVCYFRGVFHLNVINVQFSHVE